MNAAGMTERPWLYYSLRAVLRRAMNRPKPQTPEKSPTVEIRAEARSRTTTSTYEKSVHDLSSSPAVQAAGPFAVDVTLKRRHGDCRVIPLYGVVNRAVICSDPAMIARRPATWHVFRRRPHTEAPRAITDKFQETAGCSSDTTQ
jgi:hypothetical protein